MVWDQEELSQVRSELKDRPPNIEKHQDPPKPAPDHTLQDSWFTDIDASERVTLVTNYSLLIVTCSCC